MGNHLSSGEEVPKVEVTVVQLGRHEYRVGGQYTTDQFDTNGQVTYPGPSRIVFVPLPGEVQDPQSNPKEMSEAE